VSATLSRCGEAVKPTCARRVGCGGGIMGSPKYRNVLVGESQSVLTPINPIISTRPGGCGASRRQLASSRDIVCQTRGGQDASSVDTRPPILGRGIRGTRTARTRRQRPSAREHEWMHRPRRRGISEIICFGSYHDHRKHGWVRRRRRRLGGGAVRPVAYHHLSTALPRRLAGWLTRLVRVQQMMITSRSPPWNASTVLTCTPLGHKRPSY
jgi:hypothetical protein